MFDPHCAHSSKGAANKQLAPPRWKAVVGSGLRLPHCTVLCIGQLTVTMDRLHLHPASIIERLKIFSEVLLIMLRCRHLHALKRPFFRPLVCILLNPTPFHADILYWMTPLCVCACCGVGTFIFDALSPVTYDIYRLQPYSISVSLFEIFYAYLDDCPTQWLLSVLR